jgi:hypothetical protein
MGYNLTNTLTKQETTYMNQLNKRDELQLKGDFTDQEVDEIKAMLKDENVEVYKVLTKSHGVEELVQIVFEGFSIISFGRDALISELLKILASKIGTVFEFIRKKKKVHTFCIYIQTNNQGNDLYVDICFAAQKLEVLVETINKNVDLDHIGSNTTSGQTINIVVDGKDKVEVIIFD